MPRSVNHVASKARRKKILKLTRGYFGARKNVWTVAKNTWEKGLTYAFRSLLAGLSPETPLGRIVAIRSETDKNVIHNFTRDQKRIYDEWREREVETMPQEMFEKQMASLELMMARLCG